jgi:L-aspartate oxidase
MTAGAGVLRTGESLATAESRLARLAEERPSQEPTTEAWETTNLHQVGAVLARHAALREETRGGHWREDHPERDDEHWLGHLVTHLDAGGEVRTDYRPLPVTTGEGR